MLQWYFRQAMTTSFHIHSSSLCTSHGYWYWHSWMFTFFSFCVQWTVILADWWMGSFDCRQYTTVVETAVCQVQMKNVYCAGWWSCAVETLLLPYLLKTRQGLLTVLVTGISKHGTTESAAQICDSRQWGCQLTARMGLTCHLQYKYLCRMVRQAVRHWRNRNQSEYWTEVCVHARVCVKFLILDPC